MLTEGKSGGKNGYQLRLKDVVCSAIQEYLILELISEFKKKVFPLGLTREKGIDELYKWELINNCSGISSAQILRNLLGTNLINNRFDGAALKKLLESEEDDLARCFDILRGTPDGLQGRYNSFRQDLDFLTGDRWQYKISDERMAASFLACADPEHFTFYKNDPKAATVSTS